jgi:glycosyltransferase involved in cell wall biosynthesis
MRLFINYKLNQTGKGKFLQRLIPALESISVECRFKEKGCDICLHIAWEKYDRKFKIPQIVRIDGLSFDKGDQSISLSRKLISTAIAESKGVIWQSQFSKYILSPMLKYDSGKKETIIFNGANPHDYDIEPVKSGFNFNVIMSGHWYKGRDRGNKRLRDMLEIAEIYTYSVKNACFWVAGETQLKSNNPQIKFLGHISEKLLRHYLKMADCMLYLAYYDWCPNSVVESLVAGTPVICSNGTGVEELVGNDGGKVLKLDDPVTSEKIMSLQIPSIDYDKVLVALSTMQNYPCRINRPDLHIDVIAGQYKQFFEKCLQ